MTVSRIPSRMLREAAVAQDDGEDLAEFVIFLLDALEIPEVRDAVRAALELPAPAPQTPMPRPTQSGRGIRRGR